MFSLLTAKYASELSRSPAYQAFRSTVPQRKLIVDEDASKVWTYYDAGPRDISSPLVCLPPVSGTAITFYQQILALTARGYRVIAVQYPVYWSIKEFSVGFRKLLDKLNLNKVHIFGASLGGFLAQKFVEDTVLCPRVKSLILCNSFCDTSIFNYGDMAPFFWMLPAAFLKKLVMANYAQGPVESTLADSIDFMVEQIESLSQQELASRLTLNCQSCAVNTDLLQHLPITIIDVFDDCALSPQAKEHLHSMYPNAKKAHLKKGRNFPYLSACDQVNLHIQVHLRQFINTPHSACLELSAQSSGNVSPAIEAVEDGADV